MKIDSHLNPFVFVCGVPRSGTTLLQRMLNSHPELNVVNDSHFIPRALENADESLVDRAASGESIPLTAELIQSVRTYHRFWRIPLTAREFELACETSTTYQQLVARIYFAVAKKSGKPWGGEKTPDYVRRLKFLQGMFPNSKVVHIVRDDRNVALSLRDWANKSKGPGKLELWPEHPIAVSALWWSWFLDAWLTQSASVPKSFYQVIRYEDLVDEPELVLRKICNFLSLDYSKNMLEYHASRPADTKKSHSAKKAWLPPTRGIRNWRDDFNLAELELFELLAGEMLINFGYETRVGYSQSTVEIATRIRAWWSENFLARQARNGIDRIRGESSLCSENGGD